LAESKEKTTGCPAVRQPRNYAVTALRRMHRLAMTVEEIGLG
jgi:hypothetical protein